MREKRRAQTARGSQQPRPIITLTSDFGLADSYVAAMKAAIIKHCPQARLIDVTHNVPRHDILCGSITLERAVDGFPAGTIHLAVIDPGVGSDRRLIVTNVSGHTIVCPDNGLITWTLRVHGTALDDRKPGISGAAANARVSSFREITWRPRNLSSTFHG